jgi:hypothetical protein
LLAADVWNLLWVGDVEPLNKSLFVIHTQTLPRKNAINDCHTENIPRKTTIHDTMLKSQKKIKGKTTWQHCKEVSRLKTKRKDVLINALHFFFPRKSLNNEPS